MRAVVGIASLQHGVAGLLKALAVPHLIAAGAAALLLIGLWTPFAGVLLALAECLLAILDPTDTLIHILLGASGAALAMLGPGAWSVDARRFGRKRIQIP